MACVKPINSTEPRGVNRSTPTSCADVHLACAPCGAGGSAGRQTCEAGGPRVSVQRCLSVSE